MHPIVFRIPVPEWLAASGYWPLRFFGLFIVDAFFATLWVQWAHLARTNPAFAAKWKRFTPIRVAVLLAVLGRVAFLLTPIDWGYRLGAIFLTDVAAMVYARIQMGKGLDDAGQEGRRAEFVFSLGFWLLVVGFIGSRLFWIVTTPTGQKDFAERPLHALFAIWEGGIVYYGGLLFAAGFGAWYLWVRKGKGILDFGDFVMAGVAFTLFIGRWACFSAGCDFGRETDKPWGLVYDPLPGGIDRDSLIPSAVQGRTPCTRPSSTCALNGLPIFLILCFALRKRQFHGQCVWLFFILYAVGRSTVEFFRADTERGLYEIGGQMLSSSQIISIPCLIVGVFLSCAGT